MNQSLGAVDGASVASSVMTHSMRVPSRDRVKCARSRNMTRARVTRRAGRRRMKKSINITRARTRATACANETREREDAHSFFSSVYAAATAAKSLLACPSPLALTYCEFAAAVIGAA